MLVLRPGAIGDTLVTLPALAALRHRYPDARIEVAGNATALPAVAATGLIDGWMSFDDPRVTRLFMAREPATDDHFGGLDVAIAWGRDPDGTLRAGLERRGADQIVVVPSRPDPEHPVHVARHLLRSLAPLGIELDDVSLEVPVVRIPPEARTVVHDELVAAGLGQQPFVVMHPGSGSLAKNWPAEQYAVLVDLLRSELGLPSVILGGPADADALAVLQDRPSGGSAVLLDRPLLVLAALLGRARAYVGNDSGLSHLAGLLGVPTVALFGPSDPTVWAPLGPRVRVVRAASLEALAPYDVLAALAGLLSDVIPSETRNE